MGAKDMSYVVLKLFPFYLIVKGMDAISRMVLYWYGSRIKEYSSVLDGEAAEKIFPLVGLICHSLSIVFLFTVAVLIWKRTPEILGAHFKDNGNTRAKSSEFLNGGFAILGLFIFSHAVPILLGTIGSLINNPGGTENYLNLAGVLVSLLIGLALLKWAKPFSVFINKLNSGAAALARRIQIRRA